MYFKPEEYKLNRQYSSLLKKLNDHYADTRITHDTNIEYLVAKSAMQELKDKVEGTVSGGAKDWWDFRLMAISVLFDRFDSLASDLSRASSAIQYYSELSTDLHTKLIKQQEFEDVLVDKILNNEEQCNKSDL